MKRLLAVLVLTCLLTGCAAPGPYIPTGNGLYEGVDDPPKAPVQSVGEVRLAYNKDSSFHPYTATDVNNRCLLPLIYQGLFATDENYRTHPILCRSYKVSVDMRTWTFYLENATFSDGQPLTANDVAASLLAADDDGFYEGRFEHVLDIQAVEDSVVISMDTPFENLPLLLDIPIIKETQLTDEIPLGTGPYVLEDAGSSKQLRRQSAWWCKATLNITAPVIPLLHAVTQGDLWDLYKFSGLSMVCTDSYVDFRGDYELWESENGLFMYILCNTETGVFSNKNIRSALTHAIDRDGLVKKLFHGFAHSTTLPASPASPYYNATLAEKYTYDPDKFTQAVEEAELEDKSVVILVNRHDLLRLRTAQTIAEMLTELGFTVTIPELKGWFFTDAYEKGKYDLFIGQTKLSPNMDLSEFFADYGGVNPSGTVKFRPFAMSMEALANSGNYQSLHKLVMEDGLICPILMRSYSVYCRRGVLPGLSPARDNLFFYTLGKSTEDIQITE